MRIRGWSIDGFGRLHDFTVSGLPDGLTVLHGANEVGKSTLLEFLRCILFGGPEGAGPPPYVPLNGAPHRGRVVVASAAGELVIERDFDRAAPPSLRRRDGQPVDASELHRLLGGADDRLFRSVFAFSVDDLRSLATLDAAGVRDALFSAALAGAGRSARAAAQALRSQAGARFDGEGGAQINRLIAELDALRPRLSAARHAALAYPEQCAAAQRLAAAIDGQRALLADRRAARVRDDALLRVWPAWEALLAARAELAALEPVEAPPADAEASLSRARERVGAALGVVQTLRGEQSAAEQRLALLPTDTASDIATVEVEALHAELPEHRFRLAALSAARRRHGEAAPLLAERVRHAGPDWTVERVRAWTGVDRDSVREWQVRTRAAAERCEQAQQRLAAATQVLASARREHDAAAAELSTLPQSEDVERRRHALAGVRAGLDGMSARRSAGEAMVQTLQANEAALRALAVEPDPPMSIWLAMTLEGTTIVSAVAVFLAFSRSMVEVGLAALALVALAGTASRWARERYREQRRREEERQTAQQALRSEIDAARRKRDAESHRAAQLADEVAAQAAALDLPRTPSSAELEARERALAEEAAAAARTAQARARLAELDRVVREREADEQRQAAEVAAAATARQANDREWTAWSAAVGLGSEGAPEGALARIALLEAAQAAAAAMESAERELRQLAPSVDAWDARARAVLAGRAGGELAAEALVDRIVALRAELQEAAPRRLRRLALIDEMRERAARLAAAEAEVAVRQAEFDATLRAAGVRDEADLARRRVLAERRAALERTSAEREAVVVERLGDQGTLADLAAGAVDAWRQRTRQADEQIAALERHIDQLAAELNELRAACRALEESSAVAGLEAEWAAAMAELGEAVREWRVLAAAEGLIEDARRGFERTRQPAVLRAASIAFSAVTGGCYERITQDESAEALVVVERDDRRQFLCNQLSRGTTEQLYLSLRLGLAQELGRLGVALPLVMDDVLVNFDPERALAMAAVLGTFARQQQVLFFTCHPSTRDLLLEHGAAARVVEL
jgi:uncharacterized protein YhaN